jgi:signal transduction histidine kinase
MRPSSQTARLLILPFTLLAGAVVLAGVLALLLLHLDAPGPLVSLASARIVVLISIGIGLAGVVVGFFIARAAVREGRRAEGHVQALYRRASLTEIAAELVHDLRNPLMALRANAKALLVSPSQAAEIATELDREIIALNDKLSGFLDLTRQRDEHYVATEIADLIADAVRLADPIISAHGIGVDLAIPTGLPRVILQRGAMRDALLNLLINAAQSGQVEGSIQVIAARTGKGLSIRIEDRGAGIQGDTLGRVFEPFFTTKVGGNGLGLAIVRRSLESHHGQVRIENRQTGGVRVTLRLPLSQPEIPRWWTSSATHSRT